MVAKGFIPLTITDYEKKNLSPRVRVAIIFWFFCQVLKVTQGIVESL